MRRLSDIIIEGAAPSPEQMGPSEATASRYMSVGCNVTLHLALAACRRFRACPCAFPMYLGVLVSLAYCVPPRSRPCRPCSEWGTERKARGEGPHEAASPRRRRRLPERRKERPHQPPRGQAAVRERAAARRHAPPPVRRQPPPPPPSSSNLVLPAGSPALTPPAPIHPPVDPSMPTPSTIKPCARLRVLCHRWVSLGAEGELMLLDAPGVLPMRCGPASDPQPYFRTSTHPLFTNSSQPLHDLKPRRISVLSFQCPQHCGPRGRPPPRHLQRHRRGLVHHLARGRGLRGPDPNPLRCASSPTGLEWPSLVRSRCSRSWRLRRRRRARGRRPERCAPDAHRLPGRIRPRPLPPAFIRWRREDADPGGAIQGADCGDDWGGHRGSACAEGAAQPLSSCSRDPQQMSLFSFPCA